MSLQAPRLVDTDRAVWQARIDLAAAYRLAVRHGFDEGICNHLTLMLPGRDDAFLLIPFGLHWSEVTASALLVVDLDGRVLEGAGRAETTAVCIHAPIHRARPEARCVLHTHMPYATALTMRQEMRLEMASQTAAGFHGRIAYDEDYAGIALDPAEGERLARVLGDKAVLFMANHGVLAVGPSVAAAYTDLYFLERACQLQLYATAGGAPLRRLEERVLEHTARQFKEVEGNAELHFAALKRLLDRDDPDYAR